MLRAASQMGLCTMLAACAHTNGTGGAAAAACDLTYRVTARHDVEPRRLDVEMSFAAGPNEASTIFVPGGWGGVADFTARMGGWSVDAPHQRIGAVEGNAGRWRISHRPHERVTVRWHVRHAIDAEDEGKPQDQLLLYQAHVGPDWFQFFGHAVFALLAGEGADARRACVELRQANAEAPLFGSFGASERSASVTWRASGQVAAQSAFYAGGAGWRLHMRPLDSGPVLVAARGRFEHLADDTFADAVARIVDRQRRFWGNEPMPSQAFVLTPNHVRSGSLGGTLVPRAAVLHASGDFSIRHPAFESLIAHENLHEWIPRRFGKNPFTGMDERRLYWFSEGFTDYYTHRLLLASGLWSLDAYGERMTSRIRDYLRSPARTLPLAEIVPKFFSDRTAGQQMYLRGELLALRWDRALRASGHAGLDTVMRGLMLPAGQAGRDAPPAVERLLDALSPLLAGAGIDPRADVERHVVGGVPFEFDEAAPAAILDTCFSQIHEDVAAWTLGFDIGSLREGRVRGVDADGPAWRAGVRDGMTVAGYSIHYGDTRQNVVLQVKEAPAAAVRTFSYRPVGNRTDRLPRWQPRADAATRPDCVRWRTAGDGVASW